MASTNFERFKAMLERGKSQQVSGPRVVWAKLEQGKRHTFRFLPLKSEDLELPVAVYNHHALTFPDGHFESISCPQRNGDGDCPFCNLATQTYRKFVKTEDIKFKEAFKQIVAKQHFLLVGFEPSEIDLTDIKAEDIKVVRASSKSTMELLTTKLEKGVDFVDPKEGRTVSLLKNKAKSKTEFSTITWDFDDPTPAFTGKNADKLWNTVIELSPDLTDLLKSPSEAKIQELFRSYTSSPSVSDDEDDFESSRDMLDESSLKKVQPKADAPSTKKVVEDEDDEVPFDIEDLKSSLDLD